MASRLATTKRPPDKTTKLQISQITQICRSEALPRLDLSTDDTDEHRKMEALKEPCTSHVRCSWRGYLAYPPTTPMSTEK